MAGTMRIVGEAPPTPCICEIFSVSVICATIAAARAWSDGVHACGRWGELDASVLATSITSAPSVDVPASSSPGCASIQAATHASVAASTGLRAACGRRRGAHAELQEEDALLRVAAWVENHARTPERPHTRKAAEDIGRLQIEIRLL